MNGFEIVGRSMKQMRNCREAQREKSLAIFKLGGLSFFPLKFMYKKKFQCSLYLRLIDN